MEPVRRAVIDVGTNSIKLLVADVAGHDVRPVWEQSHQTRLGQGFYQERRLQSGPVAATALAVANFAQKARELQAVSVRVIATSAARDARNAEELTGAIEAASGLRVEIISGEQEADMAFQGVSTDPRLAQEAVLLLDVGGGSTELILGCGEQKHFRRSYALGTVRLLEQFPQSDPPRREELAACRGWLREFLQGEVRGELGPALEREGPVGRPSGPGGEPSGRALQLVGTGGTATLLGGMEGELEKFDREKLERTRLSLERVHWHVERLWGMTLEERRRVVGLPPNRADVILMGSAIYEAVMEQFGFFELRISTRGLRFAAVMG